MDAALEARLDVYWSNFGGIGERYLSFIGKRLGVFGPEGEMELAITAAEFEGIAKRTNERLAATGLTGEPALFIQREEDS